MTPTAGRLGRRSRRRSAHGARFVAALALSALAGLAPASAQDAPPDPPDPTAREVPLPAADGWQASLVHENDVGVWTCGPCKVFDAYGAPEVFGLDDKGRCTILSSYSGKWARWEMVQDNGWLGVFGQVDLDPRLPGDELYTGGKMGRLYQLRATPSKAFESRLVAEYPGEEIHTLVSGDLVPGRDGNELLLFTRNGLAYELRPDGAHPGEFVSLPRPAVDGRVRQAVVLPAAPGATPWIAAACRTGQVLLLRLGADGSLERRAIADEPMGCGRLSLAPTSTAGRVVLYASRDDGVILRLEGAPDGDFSREVVYAGPQGPRGVVAGRFFDDPAVESIAVFGYSKRVQLVWREPGQAWQAETIFVDRDKGHWLAVIETDGRNGTDELLASGYGARIVLLAREPGYGLDGAATDPDPDERPRLGPDDAHGSGDGTCDGKPCAPDDPDGTDAAANTEAAAESGGGSASSSARARRQTADGAPALTSSGGLRVAVQARPNDDVLSPLSYAGGFETKTLVFETLVRRDDGGRLAPGLASSWRVLDGGRRVLLELRDHARFHDGTPVDAQAVTWHLRRAMGLPEHAWLRGSQHVAGVAPAGPRTVALQLDEPWDVLSELCAVNPFAVAAPAGRDREGRLVAVVGSGPWRLLGAATDDPRALVYERVGDDRRLALVRYAADDVASAVDDLLAGRLDVLADGWARMLPRERVPELQARDDVTVESRPGGSLVWLDVRHGPGPLADVELRRQLARDLRSRPGDTPVGGWREAAGAHPLSAATEGPHADLAFGWPGLPAMPDPGGPRAALHPGGPPLRIAGALGDDLGARRARAVADVLRAAGWSVQLVDAEPERLANGAWDLQLRETWGLPYDPDLSLRAAFLPAPETDNAARTRSWQVHPRLAELVLASARTPDPQEHAAALRDVAACLAEDVPVVPLYVPRRLIATRAGVPQPPFGRDLYHLPPDWPPAER